jgi:DNA-directed RNA polymerase specialized sigma24 family protein
MSAAQRARRAALEVAAQQPAPDPGAYEQRRADVLDLIRSLTGQMRGFNGLAERRRALILEARSMSPCIPVRELAEIMGVTDTAVEQLIRKAKKDNA